MSAMKQIAELELLNYEKGFRKGFDDGWAAYESFLEQKVMERDPAFLNWLDKLDRLARLNRERDELVLQQQQWAQQQADDTTSH